jgi:mRNA-degrading endonuclease YafQ of YafQ-DinJ toxin-antitoxin module
MSYRHSDYLNQIAAMQHTSMADYQRSFSDINLNQLDNDQLAKLIENLKREYDRRTRHTPMQGPTVAELETNDALRAAWEQFQTIKKLQGK